MRTYEEALSYLQRYINYELKRTIPYAPGTFELARIYALLGRLGDPHRAYPTIHIAGSKGKGSTAAMTASILQAAGYRTGMYISPHLHTCRERMRVNGTLIAPEEFAALVEELAPHAEAVEGITWFEVTTVLAFLYFARQGVDVAVIEVGLGGRLDATNVITPEVSVITSLSYEHTIWLGDTLGQIAWEKAGIIKPGVPAVSAPQADEAMAVIEEVCTQREAPLIRVGRDWLFRPGPIHPGGQAFDVQPTSATGALPAAWTRFEIPLLGRHQIINATCALAAIHALPAGRFEIPLQALREGLATVRWPGRIEVLSRQPLVIADGAHNEDSARRLVETLQEWFPGRRWTFVVGILSDKDHAAILNDLAPLAEQMIVTRSRHARATDPEQLAEIARRIGLPVHISPDIETALEEALAQGDAICLTGSLSVAAEARVAWAIRCGAPLPEMDSDRDRERGYAQQAIALA
ncbi:MAG: bifunctional folylpolyglutamate synthase/dihydrofolate synthase [Chloroflexi bacterium]|nr:bifunctional folylpolyglutamate synthase/dihydrofolate synthase [Chloroflexota bacterium]